MEEEPRCAAHLFTYEESSAVPMKTFFSLYRHKFPMLAVIIDGYDGDTIFDSFENNQVVRIHCYSSQPRVICTDSKAAHATDQNYYTMPLKSEYGFRKVLGHSSEGQTQTLAQILVENPLPVMVKFASDRRCTVKIGSGTMNVKNIGNLLVTEKYEENYLMVNCIDSTELKMNSTCCLMSLTNQITATPITGFKSKPKAEYQAFLKQLDHQVATSGEVYDKTRGDPAMAKYKVDEDTNIYSAPNINIGRAPSQAEDGDESSDDYEEVIEAPDLPARLPKRSLPENKGTKPIDVAKDTKHGKKGFGLSKLLDPILHSKKDKHEPHQQETDDRPPIPRKPRIEEVKQDIGSNKKSKKPYENTPMPHAVVRPIAVSHTTDKSSYREPAPLPVPVPDNEDGEGIYSPVYEYPETLSDDEEKAVAAAIKDRTKVLPSFDVTNFTIDEVIEALHTLKLQKYADVFRQERVTGEILSMLTVDDMVNELNMRKLDALHLSAYINTGHTPR